MLKLAPQRVGFFVLILAAAAIGYSAADEASTLRQLLTAPSKSRLPEMVSARSIRGRATVVDGDTIEISGQRVRFNGIDAPESAQRCKDATGRTYACGKESANALDAFLAASRPVTCRFVEWDQYGRFVGNCTRADGKSVQEWLVANGYALDWPRYSGGAFAASEELARTAGRGIWRGEFQKPWEWRAAMREQVPDVEASPRSFSLFGQPACNIKGNISRSGERIYHLPGQKYYDKVRVFERKGERWFCSEAEAIAAGWRKSRQ